MSANRPNFYILLELDPSVDDWARIEARIQEKRREWSRQKSMGNPASKRKAQRHLGMIRQIQAMLQEAEGRKQEAKAAEKILKKARQTELKDLDKHIDVLLAGGQTYTADDRSALVKRFKGKLPEKDIVARLKKKGMKPAAGRRATARPTLDPATARQIRSILAFLNEESLYSFLTLSPRSSLQALRRQADELYKELKRKGKTDAESSARSELTGFCLKIFSSEDARLRYDNTAAFEVMERMRGQVETAGGKGFLLEQDIGVLVDQARQQGARPDLAQEWILEQAEKRKWRVPPGEGEGAVSLTLLCGFCEALNSLQRSRCKECGEALHIACPRCGAQTATQDASCEKCGAHTGDAPVVMALIEDGQRLSNAGQHSEAIRAVRDALLYWPDWPPAIGLLKKIEAAAQVREALIEEVEALEKKRQLFEARAALGRLKRSHGGAPEALIRRISAAIQRADGEHQQGERLRRAGRIDAAAARYEAALAICSDHSGARDALVACPPGAPTGLKVQRVGENLRLTWSGPRDALWRVLRKAGGVPTGPTDGIVVAQVQSACLDDTGAEGGVVWFYAVYRVRGGVTSAQAASSGPHLIAAEVSELAIRSGDRELFLSWKEPAHVLRVEVWRRAGAIPPRRGEGTAVTATPGGAQDTALKNRQQYSYRVVAIYQDPVRRAEVASIGQTAAGVPAPPPPMISDLKARRTKKTVTLTWTPKPNVIVQLRKSHRLPEYSPGLLIPLSQADRFGELLPTISDREAQLDLRDQGEIWFVPLSVSGETATVGSAVSVTSLDEVSQLQARSTGRSIVLTWAWPLGVQEVLVRCSHHTFPSHPLDGPGTSHRVTRREYDRGSCWELRGASPQRHYFSVFSRSPGGDIWSLAATVLETMGQDVKAHYRVALKRSWLRKIQDVAVEVSCTERHSLLGILVVGKTGHVPIGPTDGELLIEVSALSLHEGRGRIPIPSSYWGQPLYVRLFFRNAQHAQEVRLQPGPKEQLRLG